MIVVVAVLVVAVVAVGLASVGQEQLRSDGCSTAIPGFNAVLAHLYGDAAGGPPTMGCSNNNVSLLFIYRDYSYFYTRRHSKLVPHSTENARGLFNAFTNMHSSSPKKKTKTKPHPHCCSYACKC